MPFKYFTFRIKGGSLKGTVFTWAVNVSFVGIPLAVSWFRCTCNQKLTIKYRKWKLMKPLSSRTTFDPPKCSLLFSYIFFLQFAISLLTGQRKATGHDPKVWRLSIPFLLHISLLGHPKKIIPKPNEPPFFAPRPSLVRIFSLAQFSVPFSGLFFPCVHFNFLGSLLGPSHVCKCVCVAY